ncbi:hypothetical protein Pelo_2672 [Pelomyxa schiedti]|nr:hypothetical protein Pelo_2672 [Pelomyxa schiedti]
MQLANKRPRRIRRVDVHAWAPSSAATTPMCFPSHAQASGYPLSTSTPLASRPRRGAASRAARARTRTRCGAWSGGPSFLWETHLVLVGGGGMKLDGGSAAGEGVTGGGTSEDRGLAGCATGSGAGCGVGCTAGRGVGCGVGWGGGGCTTTAGVGCAG